MKVADRWNTPAFLTASRTARQPAKRSVTDARRSKLASSLLPNRAARSPLRESKGSSGQWRQRVPKSLHTRLVERAEREGVSLNALVVALIAEGMGRRDSRDR